MLFLKHCIPLTKAGLGLVSAWEYISATTYIILCSMMGERQAIDTDVMNK